MTSSRRMSSRSVSIAAVGVLSLALAACTDEGQVVTADCVVTEADGTYRPVDDDVCDNDGGSHGSAIWLYGGSLSNGRITGGSSVKPPQSNINTRSGTVVTG